MKKVFLFRNIRTGQVKNVLAVPADGKTAVEKALEVILQGENWPPEDVRFVGSRETEGEIDFPGGDQI